MKREKVPYLFRAPGALADILAILQPGQNLFDGGLLFPRLLLLETLATLAGDLLLGLESLLHELNILESQLLADDVEITDGVDISLDVDNLGIVEAAHDLEDGIDGADVRQEGVAETSTGRRTARQAGDVVDCEVGRDPRLGVVLFAQPVVALIRDDDAGLLGIDGGIGEVLGGGSATGRRCKVERRGTYGRIAQVALGDGLEERRLADVCQSNLWSPKTARQQDWRVKDWPGGQPTMPLLRLFPGRPRRIFSSTTCFLGGIFFRLE